VRESLSHSRGKNVIANIVEILLNVVHIYIYIYIYIYIFNVKYGILSSGTALRLSIHLILVKPYRFLKSSFNYDQASISSRR